PLSTHNYHQSTPLATRNTAIPKPRSAFWADSEIRFFGEFSPTRIEYPNRLHTAACNSSPLRLCMSISGIQESCHGDKLCSILCCLAFGTIQSLANQKEKVSWSRSQKCALHGRVGHCLFENFNLNNQKSSTMCTFCSSSTKVFV